MRTLRYIIALPLLGAAAFPQIAVDGLLQPLGGPTICQQGETHHLECTRVLLRSSSVDLRAHEGRIVRVIGRDVGIGRCIVIEVERVERAGGTLTWTGTPVPSCRVVFRICGPGISAWFLFLSAGEGFAPLDPVFGTVLLSFPVFLMGQGVQGACTDVPVDIPPIRALIGSTFHLQGVVHAVGPVGPLQTSNSACVTIRDGPPCR